MHLQKLSEGWQKELPDLLEIFHDFLPLENTSSRKNRKPRMASLKCNIFVSKICWQKIEPTSYLWILTPNRYTCCAPLMSTAGLSPIMYSVWKRWAFLWCISLKSSPCCGTSCCNTLSALLNTDGCGLPKHVYSREWVWVLQIVFHCYKWMFLES
jgi:hypothetical protein